LGKRHWLYLALGCGVAFAALTMPILKGQNPPGDWALAELALGARSAFWTSVMQTITFFGSSAVGLGLSVGAAAMLLVRDRRLTREACLPLVAMVGSAPVNFWLRAVVGRLRPGVTHIPHRMPELWHPFQRWSYPSGHAMTATICYGVLVYLLARTYPRTRRWALALFAFGLGILGFSRVYLGIHWPTDVLAGYLVGGAWLSLCIAAMIR
jgi:undecaprenyl-diphosphatase